MKQEIKDLGAELVGPGLDALFDSKALEAIPGFGSALKIVAASWSIPDLLFAKRVEGFVSGMDSLPAAQREELYLVLHSKPEKMRSAGEAVIDAVNRADGRQKAAIVGRLFAHYLLNEINLADFQRLLFAVDRAFLHDLLRLPTWSVSGQLPDGLDPRSLDGTGLVNSVIPITADTTHGQPRYGCTSLGQTYARLLLGFVPGKNANK